MNFPLPPETICNSPETGLHLHLTEKGLAVVTNFLETRFDATLWSKLINSAHFRTFFLIFPSTSFPMQPMISAKLTSYTPVHRPQASRIYVCITIIFVSHRRVRIMILIDQTIMSPNGDRDSILTQCEFSVDFSFLRSLWAS